MTDNNVLSLMQDVIFLTIQVIYYTLESVLRKFYKPRKKSLVGEVALVTGAGHGLGQELAFKLSQLGVKVICWDINAKTCEETAQTIRRKFGVQAEAFQCDVSNRQQVADVAASTR